MAKTTTFKGQAKPYGKSGHFHEPRRHSLQAKGIKTGRIAMQYLPSIDMERKNNQLGAWEVYEDKKGSTRTSLGFFSDKKSAKSYLDEIKDTDKDGVPDAKDCAPTNPDKQDIDVFWHLEELLLKKDLDSDEWYEGRTNKMILDLIDENYDELVGFVEAGEGVSRADAKKNVDKFRKEIKDELKKNPKDEPYDVTEGMEGEIYGTGDY